MLAPGWALTLIIRLRLDILRSSIPLIIESPTTYVELPSSFLEVLWFCLLFFIWALDKSLWEAGLDVSLRFKALAGVFWPSWPNVFPLGGCDPSTFFWRYWIFLLSLTLANWISKGSLVELSFTIVFFSSECNLLYLFEVGVSQVGGKKTLDWSFRLFPVQLLDVVLTIRFFWGHKTFRNS